MTMEVLMDKDVNYYREQHEKRLAAVESAGGVETPDKTTGSEDFLTYYYDYVIPARSNPKIMQKVIDLNEGNIFRICSRYAAHDSEEYEDYKQIARQALIQTVLTYRIRARSNRKTTSVNTRSYDRALQ